MRTCVIFPIDIPNNHHSVLWYKIVDVSNAPMDNEALLKHENIRTLDEILVMVNARLILRY